MSEFTIRPARPGEEAVIVSFIRAIAAYEKMEDQVIADEAGMHEEVFVRQSCGVLFACEDDVPVGFALYYYNFSTFMGRRGLYLEDLFINPDKRGHGYGKALFCALAQKAVQEGLGRMEWVCLDWNQPSIDFYKRMGARAMDEWTLYRLQDDTLKQAAKEDTVWKK
nr:GNAT family N-acetyltransferase [bacterium]